MREWGCGESGALRDGADRNGSADSDIRAPRHDAKTDDPRSKGAALINRGDLFWVSPDESRGSVPSIAHPHVVLQDDVFNHSRIATIVVCALTSNMKRATEPGNVRLDPGEGNLILPSIVVVSQVSSVDRVMLGERIGSLSASRVEQILAGMRFQQTAFFNRS